MTKKFRKRAKAIKLRNKKLLKQYPWLYPYNEWTGKKLKDYNYEFTWADDIPNGWFKSFGMMMIDEIDQELKRVRSYISIQQIKEKFGSLRFYCSAPSGVQDIISKYSHCSENICVICGKPDVYMIDTGWVSPLCEDCFHKSKYYKDKNYNDYICNGDTGKIADSYSFIRFSKDGDEHITVDISETAEKIRARWRSKHEKH